MYWDSAIGTKGALEARIDALQIKGPGITTETIDLVDTNSYFKMRKTQTAIVRNNGQSPVDITYMEYRCVSDGTLSPLNRASTAAGNFGIAAFTTDMLHTMNTPWVKHNVSKWYKCVKQVTTRLQAGDEMKAIASTGMHTFNSRTLADRSGNIAGITVYQLFRVQGVVSHTSADPFNAVGLGEGAVDVLYTGAYSIEYDGVGARKELETDNDLPALVTPICDGPTIANLAKKLAP